MDSKVKEAWCDKHQTSKQAETSAVKTNNFAPIHINDTPDFGDVQLRACRYCDFIKQHYGNTIWLYQIEGYEDSDYVCRSCAEKGAQ